MRKILSIITLIFIGSLPALFLAEFILASFLPQKTLERANVFSPFCFRQSDYLPFQLKPSAVCRQVQNEFDITVHTNSLGYRNPEFEITKPIDTKRILLLGDSFTFGYGVEDNQTFASLLQDKLATSSARWQVINAAYAAGDSPDAYYAYLNQQGLQLSPDIVILNLFVGNDFTDLFETHWLEIDDLNLPAKIGTVDRFIDDQGRLLHPSLPPQYRLPILKHSHLFQLLAERLGPKLNSLAFRLNLAKPPKAIHPQPHYFCIHSSQCIRSDHGLDQNFDKVLQLILAGHNLAIAHNVDFLLVIIPSDLQIYPNTWQKWGSLPFENETPDQPQARLSSFLQANQIDYLDLLPSFRQIPDRLYFSQDAHFNPLGHQVAADLIYQHLFETTPATN